MTMAAPRSRALAMRGRWRSTPTAIALPRFSDLSKTRGQSDEASPVRQADRQARRQGDAGPAATFFFVDRLSGVEWRRRTARADRFFRWMSLGPHRNAAGKYLSGANCSDGAQRAAPR